MFENFYNDEYMKKMREYIQSFYENMNNSLDSDENTEYLPDGMVQKSWKQETPYGYKTVSIFYTPKDTEGTNNNMRIDSTIKGLQKQLDKAVMKEEFEDAVVFRDRIAKLESIREEYDKLTQEKLHAVANQDYETASEINKQIEALFETPETE